MKAKKLWATFVALVLFATAVTACGSSGDDEVVDAGTETSTEPSDTGPELITGIGVTDDEIRIGYNADLSGPIFSANIVPIIEATEVYWEWVNERGGIAGRKVVPVILDSQYDVPKHLENHEVLSGEGSESVVMIGQSTGSTHTAVTAEELIADDMAAIPLSWYSGWPDADFGANVFEVQSNYCIEAANGVTYMSEQHGKTMGLITFPGEYGQDAAAGAKAAAAALGIEVVYDGEAAVVPGADQTPVITEIVNANPDFVWSAVNSSSMSEIIGGAAAQGYDGFWGTSTPGYNPGLLDTDLRAVIDEKLTFSAFQESWNANGSEGMQELVEQMRIRRPDAIMSDFFIVGWTNGIIVDQVLRQAVANGDITRSGVTAAAREVTVDLKGIAPNQSWSGEPNDFIVRETFLFDVDASVYTPGATVSDENANVGLTLIKGPYASQFALDYDYQGPCFSAE